MKRFLILWLLLPMFTVHGRSLSTAIVLQDTTILNDTLHITPYFGDTPARSLGNFAVLDKDKIAFQTYAGSSVLNTLRGHTPNFSISANTSTATPGLRTGESMLVIDGLPLNSSISSYYNMNSFEYQSVYALSSGNATSLYGGSGANGAFFLQSKTGENATRPGFEFNSSTTQLWSEGTSLTGESETIRQTVFTNAFAYQQDFGVVDTRVSYTYAGLPDGSNAPETNSGYANLRINTGFSIAPRFKARLILDDFYNRAASSQHGQYQSQPIFSSSEAIKKNLQGNLQLQYQAFDWLTFSSQSSLSKIESNSLNISQTGTNPLNTVDTDRQQNRYFANLYASFQKSLNSDLSISAFAGYQFDKLKNKQYSESNNGYAQSNSENKTRSFAAGAGIQLKNYLFSDFHYRMDYFSVYADENNDAPTYSFNTSLIFSEALHWDKSWFSLGKMRVSVGKNSVGYRQGYPAEWITMSFNTYPNPGLLPSTKKMFESGFDLGFINNRLTVSATYFSDRLEDMATLVPVPSGGNGTSYILVNRGDLNTKGWEVVLGGTSIRKNNISMDSKLIWANYTSELDLDEGTSGSGSPTLLGNPNPDWTGSILNQINYRGFFTSFLIDVRKGGDFIMVDYSTGMPTITIQDGTMSKLRDLSIGYRLSPKANNLHIREAQFSLSGRNLWTIYSKADDDVEDSRNAMVQKSACLSLTLLF